MPGSSRPALEPSICGCQVTTLKASVTFSSTPTKITVLPGACCRCLSAWMTSRPSRPYAPRTSALPVRSETASGCCLANAIACRVRFGDRVDEDDRRGRQERLKAAAGEGAAHVLKVALAVPAVGIGGGVGAADQHGEVAEVGEAAHWDAGAGPVLGHRFARTAFAFTCRLTASNRGRSGLMLTRP